MQDESRLHRQLVLFGAILGSRFPTHVKDEVEARLFANMDIGSCVEEINKFVRSEISKNEVFRVRQFFADFLRVAIVDEESPLCALLKQVLQDGRTDELRRIGHQLLICPGLNDDELARLKERIDGL